VLGDVPRLAEAAGAPEAGARLVAEAADRIDRVVAAVEGGERPRVACLEWLDPVYLGGHWVPQLVELAGGEDPLGLPGEKSRVASWEEVRAAEPEVVVAMPCGYGAERAAEEALAHADRLAALGARRAVAVDASAYFSRPGPRLVDGLELLAHVLHPERVAAPPPGRLIPLELPERVG
jgi:iron complex transport system substrate-binding protein